jgi:hypothetical protein
VASLCLLSRVAALWHHSFFLVEWPPCGTTLSGGVLLATEPQYCPLLQSVRQALQRPRPYRSRRATNGARSGVTHLFYALYLTHTLWPGGFETRWNSLTAGVLVGPCTSDLNLCADWAEREQAIASTDASALAQGLVSATRLNSREARSNTESNRLDSWQDASTLPKMLRILQRKARVRRCRNCSQ